MKIRKVQQKSIYFEMFEFDWMELDKDNEFYLLENKHEIEAAMALKENTEEKFLSIILIEVKHKNIGKRVEEKLISYACKETIKRGYNTMTLLSKTNLTEHYKKLGAKVLVGQIMIFDKKALTDLGGKYEN